jgi:hypothetical protein
MTMGMNPRLLRPLASGFDPRRIANLAAWYDASDIATLGNQSTGPGGATNNGPVRYFGDKSGNGRHAVQSGADSVCPTFVTSALNGLSALSFDGGDTIEAATSVSYTEITAFVVMQFLNATPTFGRWFTMRVEPGGDTQTSNVIPALKTGSNQMGAYQQISRANISVTDAENMLWMCRHEGTSLTNRKNNGTAASATGLPSLTLTATTLSMGRDSMQGRIYEVLFYTRAVSDTERNAVASYLGKKWGITVS